MRSRKQKTVFQSPEALESRQVMAANITAALKDGVLLVEGTDKNDVIFISQQDASRDVWVGSSVGGKNYGVFPRNSVRSIEVLGLGGADKIDLNGKNGVNRVRVNTAVWGDGKVARPTDKGDTIVGGAGKDEIHGGGGSDSLSGLRGIDTIYGDSGLDTIRGGEGDDHLFGGDDADQLFGEAGIDWLWGGNGDDYLNGGGLDEHLIGGSGVDTVRRNLASKSTPFLTPTKDDEEGMIPAEVAGAFLTNIADGDSMTDIYQTTSPTCSFLAALSSLARKTAVANDLVDAITYDVKTDRYGIPLYKHSTRTEVIFGVPFEFDVAEKTTVWVNGDWTEGRDPSGKLWVTLYQKAYLQLLSVTSRTPQGACLDGSSWKSGPNYNFRNTGEAFFALTGQTTQFISAANAAAQKMKDSLSRARTGIVLNSLVNGTSDGIVPDHSYAVVSMFQDSSDTWIIRVRNPWATDSKSGAKFDTDLSKEHMKNDGFLTLTWKQFQKNFQGYSVS